MNKTVNINIASIFFHIDENAYDLLKSYLAKLNNAFKNTVGKEDILQDIETRIAELFQELKKHSDYVISIEDVEQVISVLGQPEDFAAEEDVATSEQESKINVQKKLFRNPDVKYIGGVASGIGYYFGIDPTWLRFIWLVLALFSLGTLVLIYLLLWMIIPEAKTTADKLKMKGEPVNISTIEKKIKEEFEEVSSKIKDIDYKKASDSVKKKSKKVFGFLEDLVLLIPKALIKILGVFFVFISIVSLIGLFVGWSALHFFGNLHQIFNYYFHFLDGNWMPEVLTFIALFLLILIPLIFLFMLGTRLLRSRSSKYGSTVRNTLAVLWLCSLIGLISLGFTQYHNNSITAVKTERHTIKNSKQDTLIVKTNFYPTDSLSGTWRIGRQEFVLNHLNEEWSTANEIRLSVTKSNFEYTYLEIKKSANGSNHQKAQEHTNDMRYKWEHTKNTLQLNEHWSLSKVYGFQNQNIRLVLHLAENHVVFLHPSLRKHLTYPVKNDQNLRSKRTAGHFWKMGKNELICLDCEENTSQLELYYENADEDQLHLKVDPDGIRLKTN